MFDEMLIDVMLFEVTSENDVEPRVILVEVWKLVDVFGLWYLPLKDFELNSNKQTIANRKFHTEKELPVQVEQ